jgi:hypothetical protein
MYPTDTMSAGPENAKNLRHHERGMATLPCTSSRDRERDAVSSAGIAELRAGQGSFCN